ncbi:MAG: response regulator transcription factor [Clostridia bacterium]|nr:response regulator transcription factor [Clostridia bacterium]
MTILAVDDDADIRDVLRLLLESEGYGVLVAACGAEALTLLSDDISLVILDVMMPGDDGYAICGQVRERSAVPVLFLTARSQEIDMVRGLRCGGDDYLAKPFSASELSARVSALLRRYRVYQGNTAQSHGTLDRHGVRIHLETGNITRGNVHIPLTGLERKLVRCLACHAGEPVDAKALYEAVWEEPYMLSSASTIMVHIRNLRKKLEQTPSEPILIKTVWGKGYCIE